MLKILCPALIFVMALAGPVLAQPPADLDACLKLSSEIAKGAGAKIKSEADYAKYYVKQLELNSACGLSDFVAAEKIANDIRSTFHLD